MTQTADLRRRLAAVMFTDMAGYTALMQRDEAAALRSRQRHRLALERSVPTHHGEVLQYFGDGSLCIFGSSVEAVQAAIEIQLELGGEPPLRIGLHLGDIAYDEQGAYGDAVNIAARLESLSVPGGILVSEKVFDDIRRHPHLKAVPSGAVRLKNAQNLVRTYSLAVDGLPVPPDPIITNAESPDVDPAAPTVPTDVRKRLDERTRQVSFGKPFGTVPGRIPIVGRTADMERLRALLDGAKERMGGTAFLRGPRGIGKSRLGQEAAEYARAQGWSVLCGRAYPAEALVPFAPFSDAFLPVLQGTARESLNALVPGGEDALFSLFPPLGSPESRIRELDGHPGEAQARIFWHFANLVARLAEYRPLLLIIEDLDHADRSSIELFHFLARQCPGRPVFLIGQYTGLDAKRKRELLAIEHSLVSMSAGSVFELGPISESETDEFIRRAFDVDHDDPLTLPAVVHHWTGGNPFFITGTLRGLVESGVLRRHDGAWRGLDAVSVQLPHSLRDAVLAWMGNLTDAALDLARLVAVHGGQVTYDILLQLSEYDPDVVSTSLDELVRHQILVDAEERFTLVYDFRHPLISESLRSELSLAERRDLHYRVATRLEEHYGEEADSHADELAYHFGQANLGSSNARAIKYLENAGFAAISRYANREAVAYLQEALDRVEALSPKDRRHLFGGGVRTEQILAGLCRTWRRLGATETSVAFGRRVLAFAKSDEGGGSVATALREIGLSQMAGGLFEEALEEFQAALDAARGAGELELVVRTLLAQGFCFHAVGRGDDAEKALRHALSLAEEFRQPGLMARVHSALMRMHIWTGHLDEVRGHAEMALTLAHECGDTHVEFWSQWAMGAMEGLIGHTGEMGKRIQLARNLSDEIGSPLLGLEIAELEVELHYALGEWSQGLAVGEAAIELARSLDARMILPRLLVWVSQIHMGQGNFEIADRMTREAWDVSGAGGAMDTARYVDVHTVVPAHIGRAAFHLATGNWADAARFAEAGLEVADRTGYVVWAIHHIIPILGEALIQSRELEAARKVGARMRAEAESVGHPMGLAWAETCDAVLSWLEGDARIGAVALRKAAEAMEGIPLMYEATRLRRQLAGRLAEIGDREGALAELHRVRNVFSLMGARPELAKVEVQFGELGVDSPA